MYCLVIFWSVGFLLNVDAFFLNQDVKGVKDEKSPIYKSIDNLMVVTDSKAEVILDDDSYDDEFLIDISTPYPPVTFSAKDDSSEDEAFIIYRSTTKRPHDYKDISDDDPTNDDGFIIYPHTTETPEIIHSIKVRSVNDVSADDLTPNSLENDPTESITDVLSTAGYNNDTDYDSADDDDDDSSESLIDLTEHENWSLVYHEENCGRSKLQLARKSIGGHSADIGEYPWMVRLIYRSFRKDFERSGCGGTLINKHYVVTAAHCCFDDKDLDLSFVRLGEYDVHHTRDCFKGKCAPHALDVEVISMRRHGQYSKEKFLNDICLIRLIEDVEFTDYIQPICLPSVIETDEKRWVDTNMTVTGWGTLENEPEKRLPHVLQEVNIVIWPTEICEMLTQMDFNWKRQICAGGEVPAQNPCPGDSGGPLMYYNNTGDSGRYVLMGVVSAGIPCSHDMPIPTPVILARMSNLMPWLLDSIYG